MVTTEQMRTFITFFVLACASLTTARAQAVRFDSFSFTTAASCTAGKLCPMQAIPGTTVALCQPPNCAAPAIAYTDSTASTACPNNAPVTPATGGSCRATGDNQGNFGFWVVPGTYNYYLTLPAQAGGATYGPYPLSIHGSAGGYTLDSLYGTLAQACTAAGSGTLAVTRAWTGTPTQSLGCALQFFGDGLITTATGATVTITGTISAPANQQIFNTAASGSRIVLGPNAAVQVFPEWWGTLAQACTAAGSGTLAVTRAWTGTPTQSLGCSLQFYGDGLITTATGATVTITGTISAPANQQIFNTTASGSGIVLSPDAAVQIFPEWWGADRTGATDATVAIQTAITAAANASACVWLLGQEYKVSAQISGPSAGHLCLRGNGNAAAWLGNLTGNPPRSSTLVQQTNATATLYVTGAGNVIDGIGFTVASGVTQNVGIYGTEGATGQLFTDNRITNNILTGASSGATPGTNLNKGIQVFSSGSGARNNIIRDNVVQLAQVGYYITGSTEVDGVDFHNWSVKNLIPLLLSNVSHSSFWIGGEQNTQPSAADNNSSYSTFQFEAGVQAGPYIAFTNNSVNNVVNAPNSCRANGTCLTSDTQLNFLTAQPVMQQANTLPVCDATSVSYTMPNYAKSNYDTYGFAPGTGGNKNVNIRCDFDGTTYNWRIH
jgi:hypothetical protein